ncbi:hypothetical protein [Phormidium sp. CCY1219]|uniref:hypothetical protein n=1 Tax=Phormidium sp. CCY1219 TaxID=2886104 RepID=UPI002D1EDDA9|nr:hypothetical protein [Phormidium sp. CCY1219]MEB3831073.1 hypothetical protein [Phormidium sp. CCY1219]
MERGLIWLPLLALFIGLAWAGWNEYQKVEAYRSWAQQFDRAKYDIYAVLGQRGDRITWGKPTRSGPVDLSGFSLQAVKSIKMWVDEQPVDLERPPETLNGGRIYLEFLLSPPDSAARIPFTQVSLALEWAKYLQQEWQKWQEKPPDGTLSQ